MKTNNLFVQTSPQAVSRQSNPQAKRHGGAVVVLATLSSISLSTLLTTTSTLSYVYTRTLNQQKVEEREGQDQEGRSY